MRRLDASEDILRVAQMTVEYQVTGTRETARDAQQRLDGILEHKLSSAFANGIESLSRRGEGLLFVRQLEFALDVDLELADVEITGRWGTQFGQALARCIAENESDRVVFFPNYPAFLARFLVDLCKGAAWSAWYYRDFQGLKALPLAMALRTALLDEPEAGTQALLTLDRSDRARVLNALTPSEARRVLNALAGSVGDGPVVEQAECNCLKSFMERRDRIPIVVAEQPWAEVLDCYLSVVATLPASAGRDLQRYCTALIFLGRQLELQPIGTAQTLGAAISVGNVAALYRLLSPQEVEFIQPLLNLSPRLKTPLLAHALGPSAGDSSVENLQEPRLTPFGSVFLLLPSLSRLPLAKAIADWPEPEAGDKVSAMRLLLLAQTQGRGRCLPAFRDPLIRDLAGAVPALTTDVVRDWLDCVTPAQQRQCQQILADCWLSELAKTAVEFAQVPYKRSRLAIAWETSRGVWLLVRGYRSKVMDRFRTALKAILPRSTRPARGEVTGHIDSDLEYLELPEALRPNAAARWLTACIAQSILRDFATRMPGFGASSLGYLHRNFLAIHARVTPEPDRWLVCLDRPPLNMILSMSGLARNRLQVPWWDERPIDLYQDG